MKKWYIIIGTIFVLAGIGFGIYWFNSQNNTNISNDNNSSYNTTRTTGDSDNNITNEKQTKPEKTYIEDEISSFSTKIYDKDDERQNNISVACSSLNNTLIGDGETFSFCQTIGKTSTSKGYEKANVYVDGDVELALGGGICQVSTTLYNAVLSVSDLDITERHSHSGYVPYIEDGKDAAVAYGSYDLKFVNNTGNIVKIKANNTENKITIKLYELK